MHELTKIYNRTTDAKAKIDIASQLYVSGKLLGLFFNSPDKWFHDSISLNESEIRKLIDLRSKAKLAKNLDN